MSVPSPSTAVITESPWIDCDRTAAIPWRPLMAFSIGRVTSASTCSGESRRLGLDRHLGGANSERRRAALRASVVSLMSTSAQAADGATRCWMDPRRR
jgi:hypothetical protein